MKRIISTGFAMALLGSFSLAADLVSAMHGVLSGIDLPSKTIVVKTADGAGHTLHVVAKTTVHGTEAGAKGTVHGLKEGAEVVAHYTTKGTKDTAVEIDKIGKDGLKAAEGTVSELDRGTKKLVVKTADGTEQTFRLTGRAAVEAANDVDQSTKIMAYVTVYYTEEAGAQIAHVFESRKP
jgi:hypothetical protein